MLTDAVKWGSLLFFLGSPGVIFNDELDFGKGSAWLALGLTYGVCCLFAAGLIWLKGRN